LSAAFLVTSLVIVATPGVGALFTLSEGLRRGARAGVIAAFGCTLGIVPHLTAAITGTAALLQASAVAFEIMKLLGVFYLLFLAVMTWRDRSEIVVVDRPEARSAARVITSAVLANLLNPKLTLFFFAFLPQFVPRHGHQQLTAMLGLSGVFMLMTFVVFTIYGVFAAAIRHRLIGRLHVVMRVRRVFAASFVALGARLAVAARN
jgi:threonine/homoserine/homoserine lactone efflux protein